MFLYIQPLQFSMYNTMWCHLFMFVQASLNKLMETLDQSEPYFVKCIRSNAEKVNSAVQESSIKYSFSDWLLTSVSLN